MSRARRVFLACYAASGTAALVYQVAWTRLFSLELGHTTAAASTVLAAFMGGMAAGAWFGGNVRADSSSRLLNVYAALELCIGAIAVVLPSALHGLLPVLAWAYADGTAPTFLATLRVAVSLLILGVPAAAMGATFPVAVAWLAAAERNEASPRSPAATAGALYAANTAGAAIGAISAGFWLIPAIGLRATTWIGIALNIAAAAGALWLARRPHASAIRERKPRHARTTFPAAAIPRPMLAAAAAALSGLLALVYEVAWTRLLALVLGPTTYAFAIMAASFIIGIAAGSFVGTRLARRAANPAAWLGGTLVLTAVSAPVAAWYAASRVPILIATYVNAGAPFESIIWQQVLAAAAVLLPTSVALGASFVMAVATATGGADTIGKDTARVYTANTIGAVVGALAAGFLLIPRLGLQSTFVNIGVFGALGGTLVVASAVVPQSRRRALLGTSALVVALAAGFVALPGWDRQLLASGAYQVTSRNVDLDVLDAMLRAGTLEYYKEGAAGTVSVRRVAGSRALAIDGKVDASNAGDMLTQRLLGLLPVLLHPGPRDALVIGLGSGVTADAVLASGEIQQVDIVELSPEVVEASAYFERENRSVLNNPRARLLIADGRTHVQLSTRQYDVIVSEPSNPWMAGVASLFTREFFEAARARLRPDGVFCQWAHTYEISEPDLRSIARTFGSVFPEGTMWLVGESDLLLIASPGASIEARLTATADRARKGSVPALLAAVGVPPGAAAFMLLSQLTGGPSELAAFGEGATLQTDDRMSLEFTAARAMYSPPAGAAASLSALAERATRPAIVRQTEQAAGAADWSARGRAALQANAHAMAYASFRRALSLDGRSADALRGSTDAAAGTRTLNEHIPFLERIAAAEPGNVEVRVELSRVLAMLGSTEEAIAAANDAARLDPARAEPREQLASILADAGDPVRLAAVANELVARFPARGEGRYYQAAALFLAGRPGDAQRPIRTLLAANPRHAKGQNLLGAMCAALANYECASAAFAAALELDPRDSSVYVNLGYLSLARADPAAAAGFFGEALAVDPTSEAARKGFAEARAPITSRFPNSPSQSGP